MKALVIAFIVLNILDAVSTMVFIQTGLGVEKNPAMRWLIDTSPYLFMAVKFGACALMFPFIANPDDKRLKTALKCIVVAYVLVALNHIFSWIWVLR